MGEVSRQRVHAERRDAGARVPRCKVLNAPEVAPVDKAEDTSTQFQCNVHVDVVWVTIGFCGQFLCGRKPQQLAIETKVQDKDAATEVEDEVLAATRYAANGLPFRRRRKFCGI